MRIFSDQEKLFNPDKFAWNLHIIGAGGIGNMLIQLFAKLGVRKIHVWDDDIFETRNGPTEVAYNEALAGDPKVDVAAATVNFLIGNHCTFVRHQERVTADTPLDGIVISGVDSMRSRKEIWQAIQNSFPDVVLYIDARSAGEEIAIFNVDPLDEETAQIYEDYWLFDDSEATQLACGARNIGYISTLIASIVTANVCKYEQGKQPKFYQQLTTENIQTMF